MGTGEADVAVSVHVDAPADAVYDLVADLPRMGEWSPECTSVAWREGSRGAVPGARFRGWNRRGPIRWFTDAVVAEAERGRALAFDVRLYRWPIARWAYRFEADASGQGCTVTEEWTDRRSSPYRIITGVALNVHDRPSHNRTGMERTLDQLKAAAEAGGR